MLGSVYPCKAMLMSSRYTRTRHGSRQPKELTKTQGWQIMWRSQKQKNQILLSEVGLPGAEIVGAPVETNSMLSRAP